MTTEQTPKAKITNTQYVAMQHKISEMYKVLIDMARMIGDIDADRQSKHDSSNGELFADCDDLYKIEKEILYTQQRLNYMRDALREMME